MLTTDTSDPFSGLSRSSGGSQVEPAIRLAGTATRPFRRVGLQGRESLADACFA